MDTLPVFFVLRKWGSLMKNILYGMTWLILIMITVDQDAHADTGYSFDPVQLGPTCGSIEYSTDPSGFVGFSCNVGGTQYTITGYEAPYKLYFNNTTGWVQYATIVCTDPDVFNPSDGTCGPPPMCPVTHSFTVTVATVPGPATYCVAYYDGYCIGVRSGPALQTGNGTYSQLYQFNGELCSVPSTPDNPVVEPILDQPGITPTDPVPPVQDDGNTTDENATDENQEVISEQLEGVQLQLFNLEDGTDQLINQGNSEIGLLQQILNGITEGNEGADSEPLKIDESGTPVGDDNMFDDKVDSAVDEYINGIGNDTGIGSGAGALQFDPGLPAGATCQQMAMSFAGYTTSFPGTTGCAMLQDWRDIAGWFLYVVTGLVLLQIAMRRPA